jgi:hypothetical protein
MATRRTADGDSRPLARITPRSLPEVLAVAGALTYGVTYLACALFYEPLGVEPADVGLSYADLLAQSAVYLGIVFALPAGYTAFLSSMGWLKKPGRAWAGVGVLGLLTVFTLITSGMAGSIEVRDGKEPFDAFGVGLLPWSDTGVARVRWTGTTQGRPPLPRCVIRLGESAGTEVLYDPDTSTTLRLPQSSVAVTIRPDAAGC